MAGTWRLEPVDAKTETEREKYQAMVINFRADGTFTMVNAVPTEGEYTVKDGTVSLRALTVGGKPISDLLKQRPGQKNEPLLLKQTSSDELTPSVEIIRGQRLVYRRLP